VSNDELLVHHGIRNDSGIYKCLPTFINVSGILEKAGDIHKKLPTFREYFPCL
jgi:hypothetical protein